MICAHCDEDFSSIDPEDKYDKVQCENCEQYFCSQACLDEHYAVVETYRPY